MPQNPLKKHRLNIFITIACVIAITVTVGSMFILDDIFVKNHGNYFLLLAGCIAGICFLAMHDILKKENITFREAFTIFVESLRGKK